MVCMVLLLCVCVCAFVYFIFWMIDSLLAYFLLVQFLSQMSIFTILAILVKFCKLYRFTSWVLIILQLTICIVDYLTIIVLNNNFIDEIASFFFQGFMTLSMSCVVHLYGCKVLHRLSLHTCISVCIYVVLYMLLS